MKYLFQIGLFVALLLGSIQVSARNIPVALDSVAPKVFVIGDYESDFERFTEEYQTSLISVCKSDMNFAFSEWVMMMREMEKYADKIGYDLKGTQMWVNVFWNKKGKIDYIAYYLKPKSRNLKKEEIESFLTNFVSFYQFPLIANSKFSHYGAISFPIAQALPSGN
jgi:hypothetical protein